MSYHNPPTTPRKSATFDDYTLSEIRRAAQTGIYDIRGAGAKRRVPHFDDLLFLGASISRYPLEGYREKCTSNVVLGTRFAKKPIELQDILSIRAIGATALSANGQWYSYRLAPLQGDSEVIVKSTAAGLDRITSVFRIVLGQTYRQTIQHGLARHFLRMPFDQHHDRNQDPHQNQDDRNHDQQLDQREAVAANTASMHVNRGPLLK